jgi:hypothetical protein
MKQMLGEKNGLLSERWHVLMELLPTEITHTDYDQINRLDECFMAIPNMPTDYGYLPKRECTKLAA